MFGCASTRKKQGVNKTMFHENEEKLFCLLCRVKMKLHIWILMVMTLKTLNGKMRKNPP